MQRKPKVRLKDQKFPAALNHSKDSLLRMADMLLETQYTSNDPRLTHTGGTLGALASKDRKSYDKACWTPRWCTYHDVRQRGRDRYTAGSSSITPDNTCNAGTNLKGPSR